MNSKIKKRLKTIRNFFERYFKNNSFKKNGGGIIKYDYSVRFRNTHIIIRGNNNKIIFGKGCSISGLCILVLGDNNCIEFGNNVVVNASKTQPTVINAIGGKNIIIGDDVLISNNIEIHTSDYHGIYDKSGKRTNHDKDVFIGNKVWIGLGCKILKGSSIANGSVIGAGTVLSKKFDEENVIIAGNPGKIIKRHVYWNDVMQDTYPIGETTCAKH